MVRLKTVLFCALACCVFSRTACAQLPAFPGAEGAGAYAVGGRNGDVYIVNNLNNSGTGSLRHAIDTAPGSGRMIVFSVSGTIDLLSDLTIDSPFITIAGQTAPAGGITLAHRSLRISDTNNVIVQHIATRPGDFATVPDVYEPDSLWIRNSDNVIVDHISASWSTDEVLSTSHTSDQVTVQWSYITEALHNSNHGDGMGNCCENHGYGGIIDGQQITYHHNLYAHNRSRNPRAGGQFTDADFVNNVLYNPGDRFGYGGSTDNMDINLIGNFGIGGPDTTSDHLFLGDSANTRIHASGNYMDLDGSGDKDADGILEPNPSTGSNTLGGTLGSDYVINASPVNVGGITVNATTAPTAYVQVLSYAGANRASHDPIDSRVLRTVLNQKGAHLDSQDEVGGWWYPTSQSVSLDPDGLPNSWKIANGFDPDDNTVGLQKPVPGGYTNLELYLHELNARYVPPSSTEERTISTAFGAGADAQVNENGGLSALSSGDGTGSALNAQWGGSSGSVNQAIVMRFDLSDIEPGSVTDARLELTAASAISGTHNFTVYGLEHDAAGWDWNEASVEFANAPAVGFDGNSSTLGVNDLFDDGSATTYGDPTDLLRLGVINISSVAAGGTVSLDNPNLAVFLNMAAYFQGESQDGLVTLILQQNNNASAASFYSKEGSLDFAPRLVVDAVVDALSGLAGDYNNNNVVDAADYTVWRDAMEASATLLDNDPSPGSVDESDFLYWRDHFGESLGSGSGQGLAAVPEPTTLLLALVAVCWISFGRAKSSCLPSRDTSSGFRSP